MLIILAGLRLVTGLKEIIEKLSQVGQEFRLLFWIKLSSELIFSILIAMKIKPNCVRIKKQYIDEALAF